MFQWWVSHFCNCFPGSRVTVFLGNFMKLKFFHKAHAIFTHFSSKQLNRFMHVKFIGLVQPITAAHNKVRGLLGVFPKYNKSSVNSANSGKLVNHWIMNWAHFKDPVSHMCLGGAVIACWPLTKEVAGWQEFEPIYWMTYFCHWICWIQWKYLGKTQMVKRSTIYGSNVASLTPPPRCPNSFISVQFSAQKISFGSWHPNV